MSPPITILSGGETAMSSLDIARITDKNHGDVLRDIRNTFEQAEIGESKFAGTYIDSQNKARPCYYLPKFELDLVVSGYSVKYRAAIIRRWHELEAEKASTATPFVIPTHAEALRLAADSIEKLEAAQKELADAAPKLETYGKVMDGTGLFTFRQVASMIWHEGMGANNLIKFLITAKVLYRDGQGTAMAYRHLIESGYCKGVERLCEVEETGEFRVRHQTQVTPKGVEFIERKVAARIRANDDNPLGIQIGRRGMHLQ